jgi:hypothetical protein
VLLAFVEGWRILEKSEEVRMRRGDVGGVSTEGGWFSLALSIGGGEKVPVGDIGGVVSARLIIVGRLLGVSLVGVAAMEVLLMCAWSESG